jgi:hypothetical protein
VHLVPFFGDRLVDRIDEANVTALVAHLRRSGRAPKTIRNVLSTLHSVLDHSLRLRWIAPTRAASSMGRIFQTSRRSATSIPAS